MIISRALRDRSGATAVIFTLALIPMIAAVGAAVDFSRISSARETMRTTSDQIAVAIAADDDPSEAGKVLEGARTRLLGKIEGVRNVTVVGSWIDPSNYKVDIASDLAMRIVPAVPGMPTVVNVALSTTVNRIPPVYRVLPPRMSLLEPEAGDYNRAYIYCFDQTRKDKPDKGRRDFVPIADNASPPTNFAAAPDYKLPECRAGETVSYMMRNVRNSRTNSSKWDTDKDYYEYFTDTEVDPNTNAVTIKYVGEYINNAKRREPVDLTNRPMLETILCESEAECKPTNQGGILPTRRTDRNPAVATGACSSGKLMYYGFEDRPGGDRDFDDIRMIISCPERVKVQDKQVRIVR
jgi:hypothetical protein